MKKTASLVSALSDETTRIELKGLEPDNLLAFLALLGLLRALEAAQPGWRPRVGWFGTPMPPSCTLMCK
jgi:hypothetical protein